MLLKLRHVAGFLLAGVGLCGCFPGGDSQLDEQKNPYYLAGKERVASRDYKGAIEAFEKALEVNPRSALAHFELGVLYEQRENDYAAAIYHYNKVLRLRPSGDYPAEHAKLRIPACKNEMIKTDTLSMVNPAALQEQERLREENQQLRRQVEYLQAQLQSRPPPVTNPAPSRVQQGQAPPTTVRQVPAALRPGQTNLVRSVGTPVRSSTSGGNAPSPTLRTHKVKQYDTPVAIARQYGIRLESLLAANPGLDPKKLKIGQTINVPSS